MSEIGAISVKISADDAGFQSAVKRTVTSSQQASKQVAAAGQQMQGFTKAAGMAGMATGGFGNITRQAGYQIQDFVVQVSSGQSAFVAFGQQGSQLASIFGPGGAVLGAVIALASAIGGTLVASMRAAGKEATILPEALLKRLDEISKRYGEIDEASRQAFSQVELGKLSNEITSFTKQINELAADNVDLAERMKTASDPRTFKQMEQQIASNERTMRNLGEEQKDLINLQSRLGQELITQGGEWDEITEKVDENAKATQSLVSQLTAAEIKLTQGELAARLYAAAVATGKDSAEQLDAVLRQKIETVYALEQAQDLAKESTKAMAEQDKIAREEMLSGMRQEMEARKNFQALQAELDALNNPAEKARQELEERLAVIMEYYELENEAQAMQYETGAEAYQAYKDRLKEIEQKSEDDRAAIIQRTESAIASMRQSAALSAMNLLDQFAGKSKAAAIAAIAINKGLALAQNAQNTLVAQTRALAELGPILGPPAAAKIGLYGKVNAALIAATGLAQAANAGNSSAQGFTGGVPSVNTTGGGGVSGPSRNISISLSGSSFGAGGIRDLIAQINDAIGDGVAINVSGGG